MESHVQYGVAHHISGGLHRGSMNVCNINIGASSFCYFMFIEKKGVSYVGIWRVCTAFLAMISGETTSTPLGSI